MSSSNSYADALSSYDNKGKLGSPEIYDSDEDLREKLDILVSWMRRSEHCVVHTGAGISTAAGIPDFRGPDGVWTLERVGRKPKSQVEFEKAKPTLTHRGLFLMTECGIVKHIISQNVDGLHLRSGMQRQYISELHGNIYVAKCNLCQEQYVLSQPVNSVGLKDLNISCCRHLVARRSCRGSLHDTLLDWEDSLPEDELDKAIEHALSADLAICMGTTLQINPAGQLPFKNKHMEGAKVVLVNLQKTPHDRKFDLIIHAKTDFIMEKLLEAMNIPLPAEGTDLDLDNSGPFVLDKITRCPLTWTIEKMSVKQQRSEIRKYEAECESLKTPKKPRTAASTSKGEGKKKKRKGSRTKRYTRPRNKSLNKDKKVTQKTKPEQSSVQHSPKNEPLSETNEKDDQRENKDVGGKASKVEMEVKDKHTESDVVDLTVKDKVNKEDALDLRVKSEREDRCMTDSKPKVEDLEERKSYPKLPYKDLVMKDVRNFKLDHSGSDDDSR